MANRVFVSVMDREDEGELPNWAFFVEKFMLRALEILQLNGEEVSVSFCTDMQIKELNKKWRGIDSATDVLSFEDGGEYIDEDGERRRNMGDIVISFETLHRCEEEVGEKESEELKRLLVHGLLHLNGYDHGEEHLEKGKECVCDMLKIQERVLEEERLFFTDNCSIGSITPNGLFTGEGVAVC